jgi:hypothetical protein
VSEIGEEHSLSGGESHETGADGIAEIEKTESAAVGEEHDSLEIVPQTNSDGFSGEDSMIERDVSEHS